MPAPTELTVIDPTTGEVQQSTVRMGTLVATTPAQLIEAATSIATPLGKLIEDRKLYSNISGRRYVRCEGWTTLAAMLGCTPYEIETKEVSEGTFLSTVEFRRLSDGYPVTRASAECGTDEKTWAHRALYARRSMAQTRATAKAARLAFSWVMVLAGYEATPREEIPDDDEEQRVQKEKAQPNAIPWGKDKGKLYETCSSPHLQSLLDWMVRKETFEDHQEVIRELLAQRAAAGEAEAQDADPAPY